jgi:hypothetical protein
MRTEIENRRSKGFGLEKHTPLAKPTRLTWEARSPADILNENLKESAS